MSDYVEPGLQEIKRCLGTDQKWLPCAVSKLKKKYIYSCSFQTNYSYYLGFMHFFGGLLDRFGWQPPNLQTTKRENTLLFVLKVVTFAPVNFFPVSWSWTFAYVKVVFLTLAWPVIILHQYSKCQLIISSSPWLHYYVAWLTSSAVNKSKSL